MTTFFADTAEQQQVIGEQFANTLKNGLELRAEVPVICFLSGDMGAGKTTFVKGVLQGLSYTGVVTSPTYNLVHEYPTDFGLVSHIDLYRVEDSIELENIAIYDVIDSSVLVLVEWPSKAEGALPAAKYSINIKVLNGGREISIV